MKPPYPPMRDLLPILKEDVAFLIWGPIFLLGARLIEAARARSTRVEEAFTEQVRKLNKDADDARDAETETAG